MLNESSNVAPSWLVNGDADMEDDHIRTIWLQMALYFHTIRFNVNFPYIEDFIYEKIFKNIPLPFLVTLVILEGKDTT